MKYGFIIKVSASRDAIEFKRFKLFSRQHPKVIIDARDILNSFRLTKKLRKAISR